MKRRIPKFKLYRIIGTVIIYLYGNLIFAQIGIGTTTPNESAILELNSPTKGLLISRVALHSSTDTSTIINPATGLLIYNTQTQNDVLPGFYYWEGSWKALATSGTSQGTAWSINGNSISAGNFLGTTNYNPLLFKVNNLLFAKLHPNGGMAIGNSATANDTKSIAIGDQATATNNTEATAIGPSSTANGYRATALGYNASAAANNTLAAGYSANASAFQALAIGMNAQASQNNSTAIGYKAYATAYQASALGTETIASGQNATALGYQAKATQANSIVLGSATNADNKVGIGTETPDERLHVNGSLKLSDGTQSNGFVLTSDANGKASWQNKYANKVYAAQSYNGASQTINQYNSIALGTSLVAKNAINDSDGITVNKSGVYKITYSMSISKTGGGSTDVNFLLYKDYSTPIPGSLTATRIGNNSITTIEKTIITPITAFQKISIRPTSSDSNASYIPGSVNLSIESLEE